MAARTRWSTGLLVIAIAASPAAQQGARDGQWRWHGGDLGSTKYAPLDQIAKENVSHLRIAWRRPAVDASLVRDVTNFSFSHDFRSTPLLVDVVLYGSNGVGLVEAFANSLPFFAAKPSTLITAPTCIELFFHPRRSSALGGPISIAQFTTLLSALFTSM